MEMVTSWKREDAQEKFQGKIDELVIENADNKQKLQRRDEKIERLQQENSNKIIQY